MTAATDVDYVIDLRGVQSVAMPERGIPRYLVNLTDALAERGDVRGLTGIVDPTLPLPPLSPTFCRRGGFASADDGPVGMPRTSARPLIHHIGSPFELHLRRPDLEPHWLRARGPVTAISLFDVIPALQAETFPPWARRLWRARVELLRTADVVLCISRYTAQDGIRHLDLDESRVVVVGTGVPVAARGSAVPPASLPTVRRPFVMYTGGSDHPRKNIPALIRAFARVSPAARAGLQFVIATRVSDGMRAELVAEARRAGIAEALVITGFLSDDDLAALYRSCTCMVYPSLYEGFGLPIVEAMSHGAPVVASSTTSCGEIHEHPLGRFDPADEADIAAVLERVLLSEGLREELRAYGLARARNFTWKAVAARTLEACVSAARTRARRPGAARQPPTRLFVAHGFPAPLTPQASFLEVARTAGELDPLVRVLSDDARASARGAPLLVSGLEATPICLICDAVSARIAADSLPRVPGIAVIWELDTLLGAGSAAGSAPVAHPFLLAALHHARRVVIGSRLDAWRILGLVGRTLPVPPIVTDMPLVLRDAPPAGLPESPSLTLFRPERLGALSPVELTRLEHFVPLLEGVAGGLRLELVACLGGPIDALAESARTAGVRLTVRHPEDAALTDGARSAAVHLDVAGATHSASLFSDALARAAGRPLAVAGSGFSDAARLAIEAPTPSRAQAGGVRQLAEMLLEIAAEIDPRREASSADARC